MRVKASHLKLTQYYFSGVRFTSETQLHWGSREEERKWQERQDSNPRPSVLETDALPTELRSCEALWSQLAVDGLEVSNS